MEGAAHLFSCGVLPGTQRLRYSSEIPVSLKRTSPIYNLHSSVLVALRQVRQRDRHQTKVHAVRRRRVHLKSDTYVLLEPGKAEVFVSEEELKVKLKFWIENWPNDELPPDLAIFNTVDEVVSHLVKTVCELEIDGEVGSVQWYQVQLE